LVLPETIGLFARWSLFYTKTVRLFLALAHSAATEAIITRAANFKFAIQRPNADDLTFWRAVVEKQRADA